MTNALVATSQFLLEIVFDIFIFMVILRFLLQWVKADFYNPVCQFLIRMTNPLLVPLRRVIPGFFGLDCAAIVLAYLVQLVLLILLMLINQAVLSPFLLVVAVIQLVLSFLNVLFFTVLLRAIASWFASGGYNPMLVILVQLTEPLLEPFRKRLPTFSGMDFSPLIVLILIQVVIVFISHLTIAG